MSKEQRRRDHLHLVVDPLAGAMAHPARAGQVAVAVVVRTFARKVPEFSVFVPDELAAMPDAKAHLAAVLRGAACNLESGAVNGDDARGWCRASEPPPLLPGTDASRNVIIAVVGLRGETMILSGRYTRDGWRPASYRVVAWRDSPWPAPPAEWCRP